MMIDDDKFDPSRIPVVPRGDAARVGVQCPQRALNPRPLELIQRVPRINGIALLLHYYYYYYYYYYYCYY